MLSGGDDVAIEAALAAMTPEERAEVSALLQGLPERWDLEALLFPKQLDFVRDPASNKTAVCSRRAGKTFGIAAELIESHRKKRAPSLYFTLTRQSAKRILWPTLLLFNRRFGLGYQPVESELCFKKDGEGAIYLTGANTADEIEKWRGVAWGKAVADETQALPEFVKEAVEEVLEPAFLDHNGTLSLIGTPAPVPVGYFHDCSKNPEWSHHGWTFFDNPWIERKSGVPHSELLARVLKRRGVTVEDPSIQREFFGRWAFDPNALVFRFDATKNVCADLPTRDAFGRALKGKWRFVFGVDLGFDDADAIAVIAFHEQVKAAFVVEEVVQAKQTISALAQQLLDLYARYDPDSIVMDTGGLGRKIAEELRARHDGLPIKAAEKVRKIEFIELMNDALRTGRLYVRPGSRFAKDAMLVEWDREKSKGDKRVISERFHSDIGDALLYAFRESLHWLAEEPPPPPPPPGSEEAGKVEEDEMERAAEERFEREREDEWNETW